MDSDGRRWGEFQEPRIRAAYTEGMYAIQIRGHIQQMLRRRDKSLKEIVKVLQVYRDNVDEDPSAKDSDEPSQKEILQHLIDFLDAC